MTKKSINLALQGGGAHGAFTWGALTRILEDDDIEIGSISGTSAGALNGAALKAGLSCTHGANPRQKAKDNLDELWRQIGAVNDLRISEWLSTLFPMVGVMSRAIEMSPGYMMAEAAQQFVSPYMYGPAYRNPLERIVEGFAFDDVCRQDNGPEFFVCTTRVRDGKIRVFHQEEVTTDVILASACLPTVFQAVEIFDTKTERNEFFYDGGFTGNPALYPMFAPALPNDIVIININPLERDDLPTTPQEIANRVNEISFNSSLLRELRAISFVRRLIDDGLIQRGTMKKVNVHMISDDALMNELSVATKLVPSPLILEQLRRAGYNAACKFFEAHRDIIGEDSSVDLVEMFS
ncbi:MAG: patatin-like phospholipase family protein [Mangrovicoccus sp.]